MMSEEEQKPKEEEPKRPRANPRIFKPAERAEAEAAGEIVTPPFPSECLPRVLRKMAEGVAELERLPVAMTGPMVLAVASAALGRGVLLKGLRGKVTPPNLFVCVCKESGTGGSTAFGSITAPLDGMQARILRTFREEELPGLEAEKATLLVEVDSCKARFKKAESVEDRQQAREEMKSALAKIKRAEEAMREPLLWTSDSTPESLAERLEANGDTLSQFNPDAGDAFSSMLGCYRDKTSRDGSHALWLKAFSNESHTITRTRGTVHLRRPCLSLLYVITPSTARKHLEDKSLLETGFLGRLLLCDPKAEMNEGTFEEALAAPCLASEISQPFESAIWKALAFFRRPRGLVVDAWPDEEEDDGRPMEAGEIKPYEIEADEGALRVLWEDRTRQCAAWLGAESERELIARETEMAARIALVLHCFEWMTFRAAGQGGTWKVNSCKGHEKPLSGETMRKAVQIRDWFKASLAAMLAPQKAAAADEAFARVKVLYDKSGWNQSGITARDLINHRIAGAKTAEAARKLLETWAGEGKLAKKERPAKGTGRKPEPAFFLPAWEKKMGR